MTHITFDPHHFAAACRRAIATNTMAAQHGRNGLFLDGSGSRCAMGAALAGIVPEEDLRGCGSTVTLRDKGVLISRFDIPEWVWAMVQLHDDWGIARKFHDTITVTANHAPGRVWPEFIGRKYDRDLFEDALAKLEAM